MSSHDGEVDLGRDHHLDGRGEGVVLAHLHKVSADGEGVLADALVEFEGEELLELQVSDDVVFVASEDQDLAEAVSSEVIQQFSSKSCLQVQQKDILPGYHHFAHLHYLQLPQFLQQLQLLLSNRPLRISFASVDQQTMNVFLSERSLVALSFSTEQLPQQAVQRNNLIDKFRKGDEPGPSGKGLWSVVCVKYYPWEYFSDEAEQKAGEQEGKFDCELCQQLEREGGGTEKEEKVKPGHQRMIDTTQVIDPFICILLSPLLLPACPGGEFREQHEEVPGRGEEETEDGDFGEEVDACEEVEQLWREGRHGQGFLQF